MLVLDIGGTFLKYAMTDVYGRVLAESVRQIPSEASNYEEFADVLRQVIEAGKQAEKTEKACVSIPGPFDFEHGISLMQHKFAAIYRRSIRPPFEDAGIEVTFLHDSTAFILGEASDGSLAGRAAPCCVMLGTGLGFAFMRDAHVCVNEQRTPAFTLWNMPWKQGIAEDYVSTRAIQQLYGSVISIRSIAEAAYAGEQKALEAFRRTGAELSQILQTVIPKLGCDCLALGGQIAKSADLFELDLPVPWFVSRHLDDAALRGAAFFATHGPGRCERLCSIV
ncbi:MAG: ROK family protein [Clostridia bacterium]|nr:ROK family protein [Clostridia bacterium]